MISASDGDTRVFERRGSSSIVVNISRLNGYLNIRAYSPMRMSPDAQAVVLLVEDDPDSYELFSEVLAAAGFSVIGGDNGNDAIRQALQHEPDLIVMDCELRGMDGVEATEVLKSDARTRDIPVMILTGYVDPRRLEQARVAGCDALVSKPCPIEQLLEHVNRLLLGRRAAGRTILVVEDDDETRTSVMDLLAGEGFHVEGATNGRGALHYLRQAVELPSLIILDLVMPGMDGWTFRTEQLADPRLVQIPIVILSAKAELAQQARDLNVAECLAKPVDAPQLLTAVDRHL
jgi:two-component system cell cycle response regulator DivK